MTERQVRPPEFPDYMRSEKPEPFADAYRRRCFRLLRMVGVLHGKGFQGLRVFTHIHPLAYRIELFPAGFSDETGARYPERDRQELEARHLLALHSGADGAAWFGSWQDAAEADAEQLALTFIDRFPELARATEQADYAYAGWYATLMAQCAYGFLPYLFAEMEPFDGTIRLQPCGNRGAGRFPLPPNLSVLKTLHGIRERS